MATAQRGRPRKPINRRQFTAMLIRRLPIPLMERIQSRMAKINRYKRSQEEPLISQEAFSVVLLEAGLTCDDEALLTLTKGE